MYMGFTEEPLVDNGVAVLVRSQKVDRIGIF